MPLAFRLQHSPAFAPIVASLQGDLSPRLQMRRVIFIEKITFFQCPDQGRIPFGFAGAEGCVAGFGVGSGDDFLELLSEAMGAAC